MAEKNMKTLDKLLASLTLLSFSASAYANIYKVDFTATDFTSIFRTAVPQTKVTGTFTYSARSETSYVSAIVGADMSIKGHTYDLDETLSKQDYAEGVYLGGAKGGTDALYFGDNDFFLYFGASNGYLTYSVPGGFDIWTSSDFKFTITNLINAVPEPSSIALLFAGVMGLGFASRRAKC